MAVRKLPDHTQSSKLVSSERRGLSKKARKISGSGMLSFFS